MLYMLDMLDNSFGVPLPEKKGMVLMFLFQRIKGIWFSPFSNSTSSSLWSLLNETVPTVHYGRQVY